MIWRAIVLTYAYDVQLSVMAALLGISERSLAKSYQRFLLTGNVDKKAAIGKKSRWPICKFVSEYVESHACFYFEKLREAILSIYPSGLCRAMRFDLG